MIIYKYPIPLLKEFILQLPVGAQILYFQEQYKNRSCLADLNIWALIDPKIIESTEVRRFSVIGTGHEINSSLINKYIGTAITDEGRFVWHLFELK